MNIQNKNNKIDFLDELNWEKYINEGIACLKRRKPSDPYDTPKSYSIVAKGITAYLSYEATPDYYSFRMLVQDKKLAELEADIFPRYYNKCFSKFENRYKAEHPLPPEQKSKTELIQDFLENEKQYFAESKPFYEETRYWEKDIIEEIKEAALYFQEWIEQKIALLLQSDESIKEIPKEYVKFWMQFTKINPKTDKPYMSKEDVNVFLSQAFGNRPVKKHFYQDMNLKELHHAAWLFYRANRNIFKKSTIAKIMKDNFPANFPDTLEEETKKIRDALDPNKRIFHKI
jgi:hypothetical protein